MIWSWTPSLRKILQIPPLQKLNVDDREEEIQLEEGGFFQRGAFQLQPQQGRVGHGRSSQTTSNYPRGWRGLSGMEIDPIPLLWSLDRTKPTNQLTKPSALTCLGKSEATQLTSVGIADTKLMTEIILTKYRVNCLLGMGKQVINLKCMPIQSTKASTIPSNIVTNICNMLC